MRVDTIINIQKRKPFGSVLLFCFMLQACDSGEIQKEGLTTMVENINAKCPQMIDSETRLDYIEFKSPDTLKYHYTLINLLKQNVDTQQFYRNMWPGILSFIRLSEDMKQLRENQMHFQYVYLDKSKEFIYNFKVGPKMYNK